MTRLAAEVAGVVQRMATGVESAGAVDGIPASQVIRQVMHRQQIAGTNVINVMITAMLNAARMQNASLLATNN